MKILSNLIIVVGVMAGIYELLQFAEEIPHLRQMLKHLLPVAQALGVIGVGVAIRLLSVRRLDDER